MAHGECPVFQTMGPWFQKGVVAGPGHDSSLSMFRGEIATALSRVMRKEGGLGVTKNPHFSQQARNGGTPCYTILVLLRLRHYAQIGLRRLPAAGVFLLRFLV